MPRRQVWLHYQSGNKVAQAVKYAKRHAIQHRFQTNALISDISGLASVGLALHVRAAEWRRRGLKGQPYSPLDGRFVALKDNICTRFFPTTCASAALQGFKAPTNARVVKLLRFQCGAVISAKTNMDEFGMGSHSSHSFNGRVVNGMGRSPRSAGGSSGGSAMAVRTNLCYVALGTDTGGSVRLPAAYTDLVGFKPSYGRISRFGVVPYANSLDTVGVIARVPRDISATFEPLNQPDSFDPTCLSVRTRQRIDRIRRERDDHSKIGASRPAQRNPPYSKAMEGVLLDQEAAPLETPTILKVQPVVHRIGVRRIGVPAEYNIEELSQEVRAAWVRTLNHLESRGHEIVPISLPTTKHALSAYYILAPAEASSNLAKYDGIRYGIRPSGAIPAGVNGSILLESPGGGFGEEVKRRIMLGAYSLSAAAFDNHFIQAQKIRRLVQKDFNSVFKMKNPLLQIQEAPYDGGVDYIVCPTAPSTPPTIEGLDQSTMLDAYTNDVFTVPASLAGLPAISVPAASPSDTFTASDYEVGMQVIGQYGDDYGVIRFAAVEMDLNSKRSVHEQGMGETWSRLR